MWKAKKKTGGVRRKIQAEFIRMMKSSNNIPNHEQTSTSSARNYLQILEKEVQCLGESGSVCVENNYETENDLNTDCANVISESDESESENYINEDKTQIFRNKIKKWAIERNITQVALKDLSHIINEFIPNTLPNDPRTILATPRQIITKAIEGGEYWHNGILTHLKKILQNWKEAPNTITLNINFDGLPIFKSSKNEFWPVLCNVFENPGFSPFVIGIYCGIGKPKNLDSYLEDFVKDMNVLLKDGIDFQAAATGIEKKTTVKIRCFICDSPARAYIKGVCNFNGKHGCLKCTTVGEYSHTSHTVVFPDTRCPERTDNEFRNKLYGAHHKTDSPLLRLPIDMVLHFPVSDSLHLIDLGIMKRLLVGWRDGNFGKFITKWRASEIETVSNFLNTCKLPSEIHRAVRGLDTLAHWKASEFRSFFYYLSIIILPDVLPSNAFSHFLMLYCGITICSNETYLAMLPVAEKLLRQYVEHYKDFYGPDYVTSNVHNLLHVTNEVKLYGALHTFSAYPFENKLFMIKRMLRDGKNPLSQVAKRIIEDSEISPTNDKIKNLYSYPFVSKNKKNLCSLNFSSYTLSSKINDKYLLTIDDKIIEINSIDKELNVVSIKGFQLNNKEEVFNYPIRSSHLCIYKSKSLRIGDTTIVVIDPKKVKCKLVCVPHKDWFFFIPLMHTL